MRAVLTLQIPKGNEPSVSVAMTANHLCLQVFKQTVLADYERQLELANDEVEAMVRRADLDRLRKILNVLIPSNGEGVANG